MHTTLKNLELLKHFIIKKLLQHVSVYKGTIIREPQPVLVQCGYVELVQDVFSVMAAYYDL